MKEVFSKKAMGSTKDSNCQKMEVNKRDKNDGVDSQYGGVVTTLTCSSPVCTATSAGMASSEREILWPSTAVDTYLSRTPGTTREQGTLQVHAYCVC